MEDYSDNPKLYCGTYAKYNNGSIAGSWLDLTEYDTAEDFLKACAELHKDESDPEFMFQDYECFPREWYSESMSAKDIEPIIEYAKLDEDERRLVYDFMQATGYSFGEYTLSQIQDSVEMEIDHSDLSNTATQLGYYYVENGVIDVPDYLYSYFDFEKYGNEILMDCSEGEDYVFNLGRI